MFTGIIEEIGKVIQVGPDKLAIAARDVLKGTELGSSIAVNGVCLTVIACKSDSFAVNIMIETLKRTNLGNLATGDKVNLERPLSFNGRLGGHMVQGHIDATGKIASMKWEGQAELITLEAPPEIMRYVVEKGFIAIDGISLTVVDKESGSFRVSVVDYTRKHTNLYERKVGDLVNLEVDIIAKYVEQFTQARPTGLTMELLEKAGF